MHLERYGGVALTNISKRTLLEHESKIYRGGHYVQAQLQQKVPVWSALGIE
jgi:hypothetical protein